LKACILYYKNKNKISGKCLNLWANFLAAALFMTSSTAIAQTTVTTPDPNIELRRQQEAERALRSQQEANTNVQLKAPTGKETGRIATNETPCFRIERLTLTGLNPKETQAFQWLVPYANALDPKRGFFTLTRPDNFDPPLGKCLGAEGINTVITRMQNALVAKGYTTSRVLAKAQDLNGGALDLHLMLGRIKDIRYTSNAKSSIPSYPQQPDPRPHKQPLCQWKAAMCLICATSKWR
jgi:hemolysin activation/secretion protein